MNPQNLDPETSLKIMELMKNISNSNQTIIMATHDYDIIQSFLEELYSLKTKILNNSLKHKTKHFIYIKRAE